MIKFLVKCFLLALDIAAMVFTIVPEDAFKCWSLLEKHSEIANIILNRVLIIVAIYLVVMAIYKIFLLVRCRRTFKVDNCIITVQYGDILKMRKHKAVINFDECFTTEVGEDTWKIRPDSVCGQFLQTHPITADNMQCLIHNANLKPTSSGSKFRGKTRYESGRLVPYGDDFLLMSFARLDENGRGVLPTRKELLDCLDILWDEISRHYGSKDVCIPLLGAGCTVSEDISLTPQERLNLIIRSYMLNTRKIRHPHRLRIICRRKDDISLNEILA